MVERRLCKSTTNDTIIDDHSRPTNFGSILKDFRRVCEIDLQLKKRTIAEYVRYTERYLKFCDESPSFEVRDVFRLEEMKQDLELSKKVSSSIREFLIGYRDAGMGTRGNATKSCRIFFGKYLKVDCAKSFRVPQPIQGYVKVPTKKELRIFYDKLPAWKWKALFMFYASSGRRRTELLDLTLDDMDFDKKMLSPIDKGSQTKHCWYSFVNDEAIEIYQKYRKRMGSNSNGKLFEEVSSVNKVFRETSEAAGIKISPQILREWFCQEMGRLQCPDRFVDAFCGRVPKSILGKRYTDYGPESLKEIYDQANLKVLEDSQTPRIAGKGGEVMELLKCRRSNFKFPVRGCDYRRDDKCEHDNKECPSLNARIEKGVYPPRIIR